MINVLLSGTRMVVAKQKKTHGGAVLQPLFALPIGTDKNDYNAIAQTLKKKLKEQNVREKRLCIIMGEDIIFKEFTHQPVADKVLTGFAQIEAKTALRTEAAKYSVTCMNYGGHKNEAGEETAMLFATPIERLQRLRDGFASVGFYTDAVRTVFSAYAATLSRVLPAVLPDLTGAAIDFGYEDTLIDLYEHGELVSQRRLPGLLTCLAPVVKADTGCDDLSVAEKLAENNFSGAYAAQANEALTNYSYDILRTLRVLSAPLHITPEQFFISGEACRDEVFLKLVMESLGLPCTRADHVTEQMAPFLSPDGSLTGSLVIAGGEYDTLNLLAAMRQQKTSSVVSAGTCALVTGIVVLGMLAPQAAKMMKKSTLQITQTRYDALYPVQKALDELATAQDKVVKIGEKNTALNAYRSNTGTVLARTLALFGKGLTIQNISFDAASGAYQATFLAHDMTYFLALKDKIYADESYYLDLQLSVNRQEDSTYVGTLHFVPADYHALPVPPEEAPAPEAAAAPDGTVSPDDFVEIISEESAASQSAAQAPTGGQ
ncbi:MAG: hypothetical protein RSC73_03075 [Ruthenibacterium sp.]